MREYWEVLPTCPAGTVDLVFRKGFVSIDGIDGDYYMVQAERDGEGWLLIDDSKEVAVFDPENRPTTMEIGVGECLEHNTLNDFDLAIKAVEAFLDAGKFVDVAPYVWIASDEKKHSERFRF